MTHMTRTQYVKMCAEKYPDGRAYITNCDLYQMLIDAKDVEIRVGKAVQALEYALNTLKARPTKLFPHFIIQTNVRYYILKAKKWLRNEYAKKSEE